MKAVGLAFVLSVACFACGDNSNPQLQDGSPNGSDGAVDAPGTVATFTSFTIDLIQNHTASNTQPAAFTTFGTLPDPDGTNNNTAAYAALFM